MRSRILLGLLLAASFLTLGVPLTLGKDVEPELRVMTWNIWHGGREDDEKLGPRRVVDVIRDSGADLVAMQETYGSGEEIATALGFHFHPRGTNVSILSRYPIIEDISVFAEFKCAGALVELPDKRQVAFYSIWLPYNAEIWEVGTRDTSNAPAMLDACRASADDLKKIWEQIRQRLDDPRYEKVPLIIAGDFNSMSHLDYSEVARDQYDVVIDWPTSHVLTDAGFRDSYRELNPNVDRQKDRTWTPRFPKQQQDRIDFIYYKAAKLRAFESKVITEHAETFPSDHAALLTNFRYLDDAQPSTFECRAVSYNIRHGQGIDGKLDLARTGDVLEKLEPDFVGLQEVDYRATRSGSANQPTELGKQLGMHAAFGPFMEFQGGRYGLAVLSRYPIVNSQSINLPEGNEPRVALAVEVRLPNDESLMLVNVHFDWVNDDRFRFAQASKLAGFLSKLEMPYILLGDFNDQPGSRTLELFHQLALEATKPQDNRFTFSSTKPSIEIDFIFASPQESWTFLETSVINEPHASDHRPVVTNLRYAAPKRAKPKSEIKANENE
jgi:endonuclease/exonuclease/phosphatase family metal-dependent hydrolase